MGVVESEGDKEERDKIGDRMNGRGDGGGKRQRKGERKGSGTRAFGSVNDCGMTESSRSLAVPLDVLSMSLPRSGILTLDELVCLKLKEHKKHRFS